MGKYLLRRLVALIAIVFVVSFGASMLIHLLPGSPAAAVLGLGYNQQTAAAFNHQFGLDRPLWEQYFVWINNILHGHLGISFTSHVAVWNTIKSALPIDLELIVISQVLAVALAVPLAMKAARRPDSLIDRVLSASSFGMLSIPPFVLILLLVLLVAIKWGVPHTGPGAFVFINENFVVNVTSLALPSIVLALTSFVSYFRVLRADLIATLQEEFITMARSKGLKQSRIFWRHAFRPSSVALLGAMGVQIGGLLAGGFVIESLMAIPGIGFQLVSAITQSDYVLVQAIVLIVSVFVVLINFLFDFIITLIDPRISRD